MIYRSYREFMDWERVDENLKMARSFLGVTTTQAAQDQIADKAKEVVKLVKASDFEGAKAAKAEKALLEENLTKARVLEFIVRLLGAKRQVWIYPFTKFYFECFDENLTERQRMDALFGVTDSDEPNLLSELERLDQARLMSELPLVKANPGAGLNNYANVVPTKDNQKNGLERLTDDIRDTMVLLTVNKFIQELPGQFVVKNINARDIGVTVPSFKESARKATGRLKEQIREVAISFETLSEVADNNKALQKVFFWGCKRYRTLHDVISHAYEYIESCSVGDVAALMLKIHDACAMYGMANGAEIVYEKDGLVIFEVKSFHANKLINAKTGHCIKDSYYQWENYVSADTNFNKQYYIWNFNVSSASNDHIIGLTVEPQYRIRAAHYKDDKPVRDIKEYVRNVLKLNFEEIFLPMNPTEIEIKKKRINANKVLVEENLSLADAQAAVADGGDPNAKDGKPLENAVIAKNHGLVEFLIKSGATPTIGKAMSFAEDLKTVAILIKNGGVLTEEITRKLIVDPKAVKFLLDEAGLNPNAPVIKGEPTSRPLRSAIEAGAVESVKILLDAGTEVYPRDHLALRYAFRYNHLDIAQLIIDNIKSKKLKIDDYIVELIIEDIDYLSLKDHQKAKIKAKVLEMVSDIRA